MGRLPCYEDIDAIRKGEEILTIMDSCHVPICYGAMAVTDNYGPYDVVERSLQT
jgi:hypothetical protein